MTLNVPPWVLEKLTYGELAKIPGMTRLMAMELCDYLHLNTLDDLAIFTDTPDPVVIYEKVVREYGQIPQSHRYALLNGIRLAVHHRNVKTYIEKIEAYKEEFPEMEDNTAKFLVLYGIELPTFISNKDNETTSALGYYALIVEYMDMSPCEGDQFVKNLEVVLEGKGASDPYGPPNTNFPGG